MKKSALALAVAAALVGFGTVARADTTLYGSARVSLDYTDTDSDYARAANGDLVRTAVGSAAWDMFNNASRLGVRGEEELGGGLSAIYQYEFGVDITEGGNFVSNRPKWVGLKGGFGSITAGTQWTPYYNAIAIGDIFNSSKVFARTTYLGDAFGLRMDNSLIYTTPNLSGFSAQAMVVANGSCTPSDPDSPADLCRVSADNKLPGNLSDDVDMWNIGLSYKNGPFFIGASYMALQGDGFDDFVTRPTWDGDQWGVAVGYNNGPFAVSLAYENGDVNALNFGDTENIYLTGQYTFGSNIIRAAYGFNTAKDDRLNLIVGGDPVTVLQDERSTWVLGYQYNFSKRTRLWVEYLGQEVDNDLVGAVQTVSIGTRHDF
ncbi:MAG: porin [Candidatus Competibacteraceae bacterium]|nr:porin [Candidatus Competibacteraceae bacterium]